MLGLPFFGCLRREPLPEVGEPLEDGALDGPRRLLADRVEPLEPPGELRDLRREPVEHFLVRLARGELLEPRREPLVRNPRHLCVGVAQPEELVEPAGERADLDVELGRRLLGAGERRRSGLLHLVEPTLQRSASSSWASSRASRPADFAATSARSSSASATIRS